MISWLQSVAQLLPAALVVAPIIWVVVERLPKAGIAWLDFLERLRDFRKPPSK
jgi:hypothetical protein